MVGGNERWLALPSAHQIPLWAQGPIHQDAGSGPEIRCPANFRSHPAVTPSKPACSNLTRDPECSLARANAIASPYGNALPRRSVRSVALEAAECHALWTRYGFAVDPERAEFHACSLRKYEAMWTDYWKKPFSGRLTV